jgi:hypothetical protein
LICFDFSADPNHHLRFDLRLAMAITTTKELLPELTLVSQGKVRDIYCTSDPSALLFVATDRISAYDVILKNASFIQVFSYFHID